MSIKEHACFTIACDICGDATENDYGSTEHFPSIAEARTAAREYDWYVTDDTAICWDCLAEDHTSVGSGDRCERCHALASDALVHPEARS